MSISLWQDQKFRSKQKQHVNLLKIGDPEFLKKFYAGRHARPTRPERRLDRLLQKYFPKEFAYNGDYSKGVSLGKLIPDFVNVNGKKLVLELFGDYWHSRKDIRWKATEFGRKAVFSQLGFDCVVIWESQLNHPESIIEEIRRHL
jgi:G:T-mismatch repair DNA endonuclease (very short patch repair protein)